MGGDGRIATDAYALQRAKSSYPNDWDAYYSIYKRWIGHRVFDCNAIAEAFYKEKTGISIDTKAKYNFANWCSETDKDLRDNKLADMPQLPGIALFSGPTNSAAGITHVGFLFKKYGTGPLDWLVLECRGKEYGLVITRLPNRSWEWWGLMDKRFEYDLAADWTANETKEEPTMPKIITKSLVVNEDVRTLQKLLNSLGYTYNGEKLDEDGKAWDKTFAVLELFCADYIKSTTAPAALPDTLKLAIVIGDKTYTSEMK